MMPRMASMLPLTATATYPRLPTKVMMGCIMPEMNWDFQALR